MGELQKKEEEMRQMFVQRVKEKEAELKEAEKEVSLVPVVSSYPETQFTHNGSNSFLGGFYFCLDYYNSSVSSVSAT